MRAGRADVVYYVALAVSFGLGLATLWSVDYLPTSDGPQHIFIGHAENLYSDPGTIYGKQFVPQLQFAGRGFALWWTPLEPLLGFRDATRVVLSLFYSWCFAGYALLVHALGKPRRWLALLGCGVALCWPLYMGFFPYYAGIGIGLMLLGFVARRATFDRRAALVVGAGSRCSSCITRSASSRPSSSCASSWACVPRGASGARCWLAWPSASSQRRSAFFLW